MSGSTDVGYLPIYLRAEDLGDCDCKRAPQWEISLTLTTSAANPPCVSPTEAREPGRGVLTGPYPRSGSFVAGRNNPRTGVLA